MGGRTVSGGLGRCAFNLSLFSAILVAGTIGAGPHVTSHTEAATAGAPPPVYADADTRHYSQDASGHYPVQIYNGTVGHEASPNWAFRNTSLQPVSGTQLLASTDLPFHLVVPQAVIASSNSAFASLTDDNGVTLNVAVPPPLLAAASPVVGQKADSSTITYPNLMSGADVSARATVSGLNVRLTLHSASDSGPFKLALTTQAHREVSASGPVPLTPSPRSFSSQGDRRGVEEIG